MNSTSGLSLPMSAQSAAAMSRASQIDDGLRASFWRLALPGSLERQFREDTIDERVLHTRRSGWLALFVFNSFLVVDWLMANDVFWASVFVRLCIFTPLGMATLVVANQVKRLLSAGSMVIFADLIVLFSGWGAALCLAYIVLESRSPWAYYYHAGFMVVMLYGNLVQRLSFPYALLFTTGVLLLQISGVLATPGFPVGVAIGMVQLLVVASMFTLVANYMMAKATRRSYLLLQRDRQLVDGLAATNLQLQKLSRSDVLTGVANRRHFQDTLQQVWARARGGQAPVSLLMLDVDHFKAFNDRYGHPAGDACLRQVAQALEEHLRGTGDLVARFGGEEFVAILPETESGMAFQAAERVRQAIESLGIPHEASPTREVVTVSVGVATVVPNQAGATPDRLVSWADRALYDAKRGQRNRVCVFQH